MSYYGNKTFKKLFSCHKHLYAAGTEFRSGSEAPTLAYKLSDLSLVEITTHSSGKKVAKLDDSDMVVIQLHGCQRPGITTTFSNAQLVNISGSYNLPVNTYAVVLDGSVEHNGAVLDISEDLVYVAGGENGEVLSGSGIVVTFEMTLSE